MEVNERIKMRRKELGMSAEQVAEIMGVSPSTIYRYESKDIKNMSIDKVKPIAAALRTNPAWLMGWSDDVNPSKEKGMTVGSKVKPFVSNKGVRLVCRIDSNLYNKLADFADVNGRTLEDEIEMRLHESVELTWDDIDIKGRTKSEPPLTIAARGGDVMDTSQIDIEALKRGLKELDAEDNL